MNSNLKLITLIFHRWQMNLCDFCGLRVPFDWPALPARHLPGVAGTGSNSGLLQRFTRAIKFTAEYDRLSGDEPFPFRNHQIVNLLRFEFYLCHLAVQAVNSTAIFTINYSQLRLDNK